LISPEMQAIIITPICAHTLSMRPLVSPADSVVELELADGSG
jgi:NAD kinase